METREILTRFKNGELSIEEAEHYFRKEPFEVMDDYAKLDSHREIRNGFPEVIFCFVVEVAPVWRVILIIIALGWVASGVYNLNEYRKSERRNT